MAKSWSAPALGEAKKAVTAWEVLYPDYRKKIRHADPSKRPVVPSFVKVETELIAPMTTLGGR